MNASPLAAPPPLSNCYWVLPGKLLAGEHPGGSTAAATRARLQRLLEAGVNCFIDLTHPEELAPYDAELPHSVDYFRKPIPDHGIPQQPEHMAELLDCVRDALRSGRLVYLHCRAGIGRTGTVAGCLLVERGLPGDEAVAELNRLWQQSGRAALWPQVPETPQQTEYVRQWARSSAAGADPLLDPATLSAARGLRERFLGALLGLAVGDAVAAATQYRRPGKFTPVGDMLGGGPFDLPRGGWSDDTAMALCLAESLLECAGFDAADQVARYHRWQQEGYLSCTGQCVGITAGTARALALAQWRRQPFSGSHDPDALDPEALSRVAPVAMYFFAQPAAATERAAEAARTTCQAPAVLTACRALAQALHAALSGQPKSVILAQAQSAVDAALHPIPLTASGGSTAPAALAAALDSFARAGNFRDAVLGAANTGGNSDVVAAACGALAGAHYTASAIPTLWRNSLIKKQLIESSADRLLARALLDLSA
ncbi:MAG TPA: ADP-ribosylglycohydrolase family protein [Steroidobacteraceae bacterium]